MTTSAVSTRSHRTSLLMMLGSAARFITNVLLIRDLSGTEGSLLQIIMPLGISAVGGVAFFDEHSTAIELLGGALILVSAAASSLRTTR